MKITFDKKNYRKHSEQNKKRIRKSLTECGAGRSVLVDADDTLIAGNGVFEQAQAMGIPTRVIETDGTELVVVKRTDIGTDDPKRKTLALADNATSDGVEWDFQNIVADFSLEGIADDWGIDVDLSVEEEPQEAKEDDFDEEKDMQDDGTEVEQGDIFQLGRHRLMCGDSTSREHIERLLDGQTPDLVLTDPPYGISVVSDKGTIGASNVCKLGVYMQVKGDETTDTAKANYELLREIGCERFILWGGNYFVPFLPYSPSWIIWDKRGDMNSNNFADGEMAWCSFNTPVRIYKQLWNGMIREGESEKRIHPTQKPVRLLGKIMTDFSKTDDKVLDCFGGSGSTLIACEQVCRSCYMVEFEPHYVKLIIARWEKLTGQKAVKL